MLFIPFLIAFYNSIIVWLNICWICKYLITFNLCKLIQYKPKYLSFQKFFLFHCIIINFIHRLFNIFEKFWIINLWHFLLLFHLPTLLIIMKEPSWECIRHRDPKVECKIYCIFLFHFKNLHTSLFKFII